MLCFLPLYFGCRTDFTTVEVERVCISAYVVKNDDNKDIVIEHLKQSEGFRSEPYYCPAGQLTIGYGHKIKAGEKFNMITEETADSLLMNDFNIYYELVKNELVGCNNNIVIAMTHFAMGTGFQYFKNSRVCEMTKERNDIKFISNELLKYCKYKNVNNEYVVSKRLLHNREFEVKIINNDIYE